jgi:hypothetical protein
MTSLLDHHSARSLCRGQSGVIVEAALHGKRPPAAPVDASQLQLLFLRQDPSDNSCGPGLEPATPEYGLLQVRQV